ncbi:MAG: phenylalanine--tRNA ligase subunit beta [Ethanoligenens sp.]
MKLSMKWLAEHVELDKSITPRQFSEDMTMIGQKVEGYEIVGEDIRNVVVAVILSIEKHPDSDHLLICQVDAGGPEPVQIVTGAHNVFVGASVPAALDGALLPGGKKIKHGKLRGVVSNGMLCSLGELGLAQADFPYAVEDGIFILQEDCTPGEDIRKAVGLDDVIVEFEITPNRPDCLSVIGLAREAAAAYREPRKVHIPVVRGGAGKTSDLLAASIEAPELCSRYCARAVKRVHIKPSPRWMRERLRAAGVRPINNIVDITNYVMLEYGQPLHAFDVRSIAGGTIRVRRAQAGEQITTLDGVERSLDPSICVIADAEKPVAVAGVMGGEHSGILSDTDTIVFEAAMFSGPDVRLAAKKLGLRTEASGRFEKGLDAATTPDALMRACELVELLGAGVVCDDYLDVNHSNKAETTVALESDWINGFLGTSLTPVFMADALTHLEFTVKDGVVHVPSFRGDVAHKADVAEEVARMFGYNRIPITVTLGATTQGGLNAKQRFEKKIGAVARATGLSEITAYSFLNPRAYDLIRLPADDALRNSVKISNPLGEETSILRTTLLPSMLDILSRNYASRNLEAGLYECGTVYRPKAGQELPDEVQKIQIGMYGEDADYFALKGVVEDILADAGIDDFDVERVTDLPSYHPGRCAQILVNGDVLALLGEVHPQVLENYEIGVRTYVAEIDFTMLLAHARENASYRPLPKFPATTRDIAVLCDASIPVLTLEKAMRGAAKNTLESIRLFDVYQGQQIDPGKKSVAFSITLRVPDHTLTDKEADAAVKKMLAALEKAGAVLRA